MSFSKYASPRRRKMLGIHDPANAFVSTIHFALPARFQVVLSVRLSIRLLNAIPDAANCALPHPKRRCLKKGVKTQKIGKFLTPTMTKVKLPYGIESQVGL